MLLLADASAGQIATIGLSIALIIAVAVILELLRKLWLDPPSHWNGEAYLVTDSGKTLASTRDSAMGERFWRVGPDLPIVGIFLPGAEAGALPIIEAKVGQTVKLTFSMSHYVPGTFGNGTLFTFDPALDPELRTSDIAVVIFDYHRQCEGRSRSSYRIKRLLEPAVVPTATASPNSA